MTRPGTAHLPTRPAWSCEVDGGDWPCALARAELGEEYRDDGVSLTIYLATHMYEAVGDLTGHAPGALHERFLAWARPNRP